MFYVPIDKQRLDWKPGDNVRIRTPYCDPDIAKFNGRDGTVVRDASKDVCFDPEHSGPFWMVRFDNGAEFPFGPEELENR